MKRPTCTPDGSHITTPRASTMMALLGPGAVAGSVALTKDEFRAVNRLYGFREEKPNKKPPPPDAPSKADFKDSWAFEDAVRRHKSALEAHAKWEDPLPFMKAGADRNAIRHAESDGLRLLAWIARFVEPGEDPLKAMVRMAGEAGYDVDPADTEWAEGEEETEAEAVSSPARRVSSTGGRRQ